MKKGKIITSIIFFILIMGVFSNIVLATVSPDDFNPNSVNTDTTQIKSAGSQTFAIVICCIFVFILYIIPMFIALKRNHPHRFQIGCLNIFLGWTFLGWVICLIWSMSDVKKEMQTYNNNNNKYEDLERLQRLKDNGTISEEEFKIEKEKILKQ